jgi:hypothetical protein
VPFPKERLRKESRLGSHPLWRTNTKNMIKFARMDRRRTTRLDLLSSQITKSSKKKDEIPVFNIQCRTASDHKGNGKYNTNKQTDDHSRWTRNPKTRNIRRLLDNLANHITLIWVPSHVGIDRNEGEFNNRQKRWEKGENDMKHGKVSVS